MPNEQVDSLFANSSMEGVRIMDVLYHRCAGLDVHAKTIVVCALWGEEDHIQKEIETFSTKATNSGIALWDINRT